MIVFAKKEGTVIWSDNNSTHKAGRVPLHEVLNVISDSNLSWYAIDRPAEISLPVQPAYPDYWVKRSDCLLELQDPLTDLLTDPTPGPGPISDSISDIEFVSYEDVAAAIVTIIRFFKQ